MPLIMGELANSLKGRNGGERANRMEARLSARPLGGLGARGTSGGVDPGTRRAAARGSAGGEGPRGFFSRAMKAAVPVPPAVSPPLVDSSLEGGSGKGDSKGGKLMGGNSVDQGRPPRSSVRTHPKGVQLTADQQELCGAFGHTFLAGGL